MVLSIHFYHGWSFLLLLCRGWFFLVEAKFAFLIIDGGSPWNLVHFQHFLTVRGSNRDYLNSSVLTSFAWLDLRDFSPFKFEDKSFNCAWRTNNLLWVRMFAYILLFFTLLLIVLCSWFLIIVISLSIKCFQHMHSLP